jgi:hypothetical protein
VAECYHGLLIEALAKELEERNLKYGNDRLRDLFVVSAKGKVQILFEAKTDLGTSSVYSAVGQLMLHGAAEKLAPKRILVIPGSPKPKTCCSKKAGNPDANLQAKERQLFVGKSRPYFAMSLFISGGLQNDY